MDSFLQPSFRISKSQDRFTGLDRWLAPRMCDTSTSNAQGLGCRNHQCCGKESTSRLVIPSPSLNVDRERSRGSRGGTATKHPNTPPRKKNMRMCVYSKNTALHASVHASMLASMHASMYTVMQPCMHPWMHTWMHAWMHAWMHGSMHAFMHASKS